jgi:hypothetical protein
MKKAPPSCVTAGQRGLFVLGAEGMGFARTPASAKRSVRRHSDGYPNGGQLD